MAYSEHAGHDGSARSVLLATGLQAVVMILEFVVGAVTGSVALIADAFHMAGDVVAGLVSYDAESKAKLPPNAVATFGWRRMQDQSYYFRAVVLIIIGIFAVREAIQVGLQPNHAVLAWPALIMATLGGLVNWQAHRWLHPHRHTHDHIRLFDDHVVLDGASSAIAVVAMVVVWLTGSPAVDVAGGIMIGLIMIIFGWRKWHDPRVRHRTLELMPPQFNRQRVEDQIMAIPAICEIDHVHVVDSPEGIRFSACLHVEGQTRVVESEMLYRQVEMIVRDAGAVHVTLEFRVAAIAGQPTNHAH